MRITTINGILKWGIGTTAAFVGVATAIVQTRWIMPAAVVTGALVTVGITLWKWQDRPYSDEIRKNLRDRNLGLNLFALFGSLFIQAVTILGFVLATLSVNEHPCLCFNGNQLQSWFNLTLSGALLSLLEYVVVFNLALLGCYAVYRAKMQ